MLISEATEDRTFGSVLDTESGVLFFEPVRTFLCYNLRVSAKQAERDWVIKYRSEMMNELNVRSGAFDEAYAYEGKDLGCLYSKDQTSLKVWAPTCDQVKVHIEKAGKEEVRDMIKEERGVWSILLDGDYEGASYVYQVFFGDKMNLATDPYARASTANHERTIIIDLEKTIIDSRKDQLMKLESYTDAVIYELHVRDFSMDKESGLRHQGKFLAFTEDGARTTSGHLSGIDYLADLGVTHIQLLPVYDFGSVDELNPLSRYNWGYDPVQYSVPEGSYSTNTNDPYARIIELKQAIAHMHEKGLGVIMDVVYNHMYDKDESAFEKIVPGYYFRQDEEGNISNGSFCGNDFDSTRAMTRKFILDSTRIWIEEFGFDGFRFDLMGILDITTMNMIYNQTKDLDPSAMVYGEGWNMPTFLSDEDKATMMNHDKMPGIGYFSDIFREKIKGGTLEDKFNQGGFGTGDEGKLIDAMHLLRGTVLPVSIENNYIESYFSEPSQTVNYVECHDNHTLWDKLRLSMKEESDETKALRHRFITAMVILSQGIPFIHAGQEFFRSKGGDHNSYKSSDEVNMFRWGRKDLHLDTVDYIKGLIELRKSYKELRLNNKEDIEKLSEIHQSGPLIVYNLQAMDHDCGYNGLTLVINPGLESVTCDEVKDKTMIFNRRGYVDDQVEERHIIEPISVQVYRF